MGRKAGLEPAPNGLSDRRLCRWATSARNLAEPVGIEPDDTRRCYGLATRRLTTRPRLHLAHARMACHPKLARGRHRPPSPRLRRASFTRCRERRMAESDGVEPSTTSVGPVFETGCAPQRATLRSVRASDPSTHASASAHCAHSVSIQNEGSQLTFSRARARPLTSAR